MSPRGVSTWSCHLPGPDEGYPARWGSADYATCTPGTRQEVRGHGSATAQTHTDIQKEGPRGSGIGCGNETQTRGLTADRPPPRSWRPVSGAGCAQGLPEGCRARRSFLSPSGSGVLAPLLWQRHPPLPPSPHGVSLVAVCVCVCLPCKDTSHLGEGPSCCSVPSAQPITSARCQFPNKATFWGSGRDISLGAPRSPMTAGLETNLRPGWLGGGCRGWGTGGGRWREVTLTAFSSPSPTSAAWACPTGRPERRWPW